MKPYINREQKIMDGQFTFYMSTKVKCKSSLKKRILRPFKKSMRQKLKNEMVKEVF